MMALPAVAATMLVVILIVLVSIVLLKALKGDIITSGLLSTRTNSKINPERVTMMVATVFGGLAYFAYGLRYGAVDHVLPDMPEQLITAMSGGNFLYLSGKLLRTGSR